LVDRGDYRQRAIVGNRDVADITAVGWSLPISALPSGSRRHPRPLERAVERRQRIGLVIVAWAEPGMRRMLS
jgi:hypothetical protein